MISFIMAALPWEATVPGGPAVVAVPPRKEPRA